MDRVVTVATCGLAGAVAFAALGALWGGTVRVMANLRDRVPDATLGESLRRGIRGGAGFLGALGGIFGAIVGLVEPSAEAALGAVAANAYTVGVIMLVIGGMITPTV